MRIVILLAAVAVVAARPDADFYDEKYENFNAEELADNIRLLKSYVLCIKGEGKCTPEGSDFKKWTPEVVRSYCRKCTEKQKHLIAIVIKAIIEKLPDDWEELKKDYDPKGERTEQLNKFIQKYTPSAK